MFKGQRLLIPTLRSMDAEAKKAAANEKAQSEA